ncbi:O-antigen ligase family protein [Streptomyces sp. NPDC051776]|uniref:O-antigen ligase family protein n=1 Tax=Streptomyces sp. NPDC051776 TaxID=3155414 RepID=UPI0034172699
MASAARPAVGEAAGERGSTGAADVTGVLVLGCCAGWALITAAGREARPEGVLLALLAVAAGYACGRIGGAVLPVAVPACAAITGAALAYAAPYGLPGVAVDPPPGHTGAHAALFALASGAACCSAWAARSPAARLCLRLPAVAIAGAALAAGSPAGCVAAAVVLLCSLAAAPMRRHRATGLAGLALAGTVVAGVAWAVAQDVLPTGLAVSLEGQLTERRVLLWHDAAALAAGNPVLGTGPDRFGDLSPAAQGITSSGGKPHSAVLQLAAEQGLPGLLLLSAASLWLLHSLWRSPRSTQVVLTAGAALTVVAAVASVGNALSFAPVTAGAGFLAGLATARPLGAAHGPTDAEPGADTESAAGPDAEPRVTAGPLHAAPSSLPGSNPLSRGHVDWEPAGSLDP